jgi:N-acetyl-1-D-myo-inositol-2-amino-2-deoxy-alpha-D-glucopyranoside deacetylase
VTFSAAELTPDANVEMIASMLTAPGASLVVVAPHPDDESIAAAGLIQLANSVGARVTVLFVTDGDNNPWPQRALERRIMIGPRERERWARRRRDEARAALSVLGVPDRSIRHLGLPDLGVTDRLTSGTVSTVEMFRGVFRDVAPTLVVTPSLADRHPDHSAAYVLCSLALDACASTVQVLSYVIHGAPVAVPLAPPIECPLDGEMLARKLRAVASYGTQLALSGRRILRYANRPERFVVEPIASGLRVASVSLLPWRLGRLSAALAEVIVSTNERTSLIAIEPLSAQRELDGFARCTRSADGLLTLQLWHQERAPSVAFAKLAGRLSSPWIYDRWGWMRIPGDRRA